MSVFSELASGPSKQSGKVDWDEVGVLALAGLLVGLFVGLCIYGLYDVLGTTRVSTPVTMGDGDVYFNAPREIPLAWNWWVPSVICVAVALKIGKNRS